MKTNKNIFFLISYLLFQIFKNGPTSSYPFFGKFFKFLRYITGSKIVSKCGINVNFEKGSNFSTKIEIGNNSGVGIRCHLLGKVIIGNDVLMGPECLFYTWNHNFSEKDVLIRKQGKSIEKPIQIGNDVWIGSRVTFLPGVSIGNGCIVGASSVVTKSFPDYSVIAGNPAKIVKIR
jgi:maltose O-acetyltransferase